MIFKIEVRTYCKLELLFSKCAKVPQHYNIYYWRWKTAWHFPHCLYRVTYASVLENTVTAIFSLSHFADALRKQLVMLLQKCSMAPVVTKCLLRKTVSFNSYNTAQKCYIPILNCCSLVFKRHQSTTTTANGSIGTQATSLDKERSNVSKQILRQISGDKVKCHLSSNLC